LSETIPPLVEVGRSTIAGVILVLLFCSIIAVLLPFSCHPSSLPFFIMFVKKEMAKIKSDGTNNSDIIILKKQCLRHDFDIFL
jgi:hypothetical protein